MTRAELEAFIWAVAGHELSARQVLLIADAAHAYASGDSDDAALCAARRKALAIAAGEARGRGYGRNKRHGAA